MTPHVKSSCVAQCKLQVQRLEKSLLHVPRSRFDRAKLHTNQFDSDQIERGSLTDSKKKDSSSFDPIERRLEGRTSQMKLSCCLGL